MRVKKILACAFIFALALGGCGRGPSEKPDLSALGPVHVIAREEGSGTRTQFESLVDTMESGTSEIASSTEEAVQLTEEDASAVSYVAMSALTGSENVKALSVGGIAPSEKTVRSKKYPLTRTYYLAWLGDQTDLMREFITFARGAGQKYAAETAVPVAKETSFLSLKPSGTLRITGSTSMTPLVTTLADAYKEYNPNAVITVEESDSAKGLTDVMQGKADLAMSSRDLKDYEQEILSYKAVASDAIVIIVNKENALTDITKADIKKIYDGDVKEWGEL